MGVKCSSPSGQTKVTSGGWKTDLFQAEPAPITGGSFEFVSSDIVIKGQFTSPTEANGTIKISQEQRPSGGIGETVTCDFGTWEWNADVDDSGTKVQ